MHSREPAGRPDPGVRSGTGRHRHRRAPREPFSPPIGGPPPRPAPPGLPGGPPPASAPPPAPPPSGPPAHPSGFPSPRLSPSPAHPSPAHPSPAHPSPAPPTGAVAAPDLGGHGHGHGHTPAAPAGRRVRLLIAALLVPCALATLVGLILLRPAGGPPAGLQAGGQPINARVTATQAVDCTPGSGAGGCIALTLRMEDGPLPGRDLIQLVPVEPSTPRFAVDDEVVLDWSGADPLDASSYRVADFQRGSPLVWLAALFAGAVLVLGRWRGLAALVALGLSFAVLLLFVLPAIISGRDPLSVAVVGACLIMFVVLYLTHGPSARTSTAVLGTLASLALIGTLGAAFSAAARLTGLDDQTANLIATLGTGVDARGLLLAGVVIGALGVLDDVTVTQTSAVWELRRANPDLGARGLFTAAMRIGRDHVSSAVNTLVLAYAGASLPLMLLFSVSANSIGQVLTTQDVATEIVRTLVGSIGLVASVPITTGLAAIVASRESREAVPASR
ncbi:YibE/F family protein [Pseudonocardia bannensis]